MGPERLPSSQPPTVDSRPQASVAGRLRSGPTGRATTGFRADFGICVRRVQGSRGLGREGRSRRSGLPYLEAQETVLLDEPPADYTVAGRAE